MASIENDYPFLSIMHPAHLRYIRNVPLNTLEYFLDILDGLDADKRHEIMSTVFYLMIVPAENPMSAEEFDPAIMEDKEAVYERFKARCRECASVLTEGLLVSSVVHYALQYVFDLGDKTTVDAVKDRIIGVLEFIQSDPHTAALGEEHERFMSMMVDHVEKTPERTDQFYMLYMYFCENVIIPLLDQRIPLGYE
jgi:hypothetical protein